MKIKLDENLPVGLSATMAALGHDVDTVLDKNLGGHDDMDVWNAAQAEERFLITQDLDFSDIRRYQAGTHAGILLIRLRNPGRLALHQLLTNAFRTEHVEEWTQCFVVLTDRKLRVLRLADEQSQN